MQVRFSKKLSGFILGYILSKSKILIPHPLLNIDFEKTTSLLLALATASKLAYDWSCEHIPPDSPKFENVI